MSTFPGAFVPVAPPADGLRLAFVAARRRRNRKAGVTGAAGVLAAVALLASLGGNSQRTLMQEPLPPSTTHGLGLVTGGVDPSAAPASPTVPASQVQGGATGGDPRSGHAVAVPPGSRTGSGQMTSSTSVAVHGTGTKSMSGPMSRSTGFFYTGGDLMCPARKQQERQRGLCTDVFASQNSGGPMSITAEVCNVGTNTEMLSYATALETDVMVRHSGVEVWRWSLGRAFPRTEHDITVGAQECVQWTTSWSLVDAHGTKVKAGNYEVVADFAADEVAAQDRHPSYPITISPQS